MSEWRLVRLDFGSNPVHFGEEGIGLESSRERVCSDTLYSAFISLYARVYRDRVDELITNLKQNPAFRLSSTYIYCRNTSSPHASSSIIFYLPRPLIEPVGYPIFPDLALSKLFSKYRFLPLPLWQRWYQGQGISLVEQEEIKNHSNESPSSLAVTGLFDYGQTFHKSLIPKVALDRNTAASNFYQTGFIKYNHLGTDQSGLYFLINFTDSSLESEVYQIFSLLGEEGLGGERSTGAGQFSIAEWSDLQQIDSSKPWLKQWQSLLNFSGGNHHCLLSLFWQDSFSEDITPNTRYSLKERSGWAVSINQRRKKIHMFEEGSVFAFKPTGQLADVSPPDFKDHGIYRSGLALSLPIVVSSELP